MYLLILFILFAFFTGVVLRQPSSNSKSKAKLDKAATGDSAGDAPNVGANMERRGGPGGPGARGRPMDRNNRLGRGN